jgi:hypothetical protein
LIPNSSVKFIYYNHYQNELSLLKKSCSDLKNEINNYKNQLSNLKLKLNDSQISHNEKNPLNFNNLIKIR